MKARRVLAVLAVVAAGVLGGSLVSGMFPATAAAPLAMVPRWVPNAAYLVVQMRGACLVARPTPEAAVYSGPVRVSEDENEEELVAANVRARLVFGARRELDVEDLRAHVRCARTVWDNLDSHRRARLIKADAVGRTLQALGLQNVQVKMYEDSPGWVTFGAWSGLACIAGVQHAGETLVAVIAPLPDGRCRSGVIRPKGTALSWPTMGWRIYMVLAVLLLMGADVRRQEPARPPAKIHGNFAYPVADPLVAKHDFNVPCLILGVPASEQLDGFVSRNQAAAAAFGESRRLDPLNVARHYSCVSSISAQLDAYRELGLVTAERVRTMLSSAGLAEVQVGPAADGMRFAGFTSNACIAGIYVPRKIVVVVISRPLNRKCLD